MLSAFHSATAWLHHAVYDGGLFSGLVVLVLILAWLAIVAALLLGYARGVQMKRSSVAMLAAIALVLMLVVAELSIFTFGADLGDIMSHARR